MRMDVDEPEVECGGLVRLSLVQQSPRDMR